jgi:hypothetical protein
MTSWPVTSIAARAHVDAIGMTALESGIPVRPDSIFRIGSMTETHHGGGHPDPPGGVRAPAR